MKSLILLTIGIGGVIMLIQGQLGLYDYYIIKTNYRRAGVPLPHPPSLDCDWQTLLPFSVIISDLHFYLN